MSGCVGCGKYRIRLGLAGKYRIGLNIVITGKIGVKVAENYIGAVKPNRRNKSRALMIVIKLS